MLALVRIALRRPYTFIVMAVMIFIVGILSAFKTPTDIFPDIKIPIVAVIWQFQGMSPDDIQSRINTPYQRAMTTVVNNIDHLEAMSIANFGIVKIFFQPGTDIRLANAQITASAQTVLRSLPRGINPPLILNYSASTVPILQLSVHGKGLTEQQLNDLSFNAVRAGLITVPGSAIPYPWGGRVRQIQFDVDPHALQSKGLTAQDISNTIAQQTQITPAGFAKIGPYQYNIRLNNVPSSTEQLNHLPIKTVNGATVYVSDVAHVRDGAAPQTNVVHVDGARSVLLTVYKNGSASTVSVAAGILAKIPSLLVGLPSTLRVDALTNQAIFVQEAISGVAREAAIAAVLTSLMIMLFLGSWRSTVIIAISIPLAIMSALGLLSAFGQTLNIMTLGGLALAVGILVDDGTVTIENINWHLEHGKDVIPAIIDGAMQIATPALVSTLCICIAFVPMFFLPGIAGFLFAPMGMSVIFAMLASFLLSRTLVPTLAMYLLKPIPHKHDPEHAVKSSNIFVRFQQGFEHHFEKMRLGYVHLLEKALRAKWLFIVAFYGFVILSFTLSPFLGRNFFPSIDTGSITLHVRAPIGTRIEETSAIFARIENRIRSIIPADQLRSVVDNIGISSSAINTTYDATGSIGMQDGNIMISLTEDHAPTDSYIKRLREILPREYPAETFAFLPADIVSQILNFGSPSPIDIQVTGRNPVDDESYARLLLREVRKIPGLVDSRIQQSSKYPEFTVKVDRSRIAQLGLKELDVTNSLGTSLAGSSQLAPVFWVDPKNGVSYPVVAQTPEYMVDSLAHLGNVPISGEGMRAPEPQILGALGPIVRTHSSAVTSQYNLASLFEIYGSIQGRDLGAVSNDILKVIHKMEKQKPKGVTVTLRGQYQTMNTAFQGMGFGLLGAIVLIYLLIVINFQSWLDPFIVIAALPGALAGIIWMLFVTKTTLSVPALTGAIMCMGVATSNSVLVISFCREKMEEGFTSAQAALEAGATRLRPVLMTALAMIIGMLPMALGLGDGGEQNAPLGRAVVGGLIVATTASLFFVPSLFSLMHRNDPKKDIEFPEAAESDHSETIKKPDKGDDTNGEVYA